MSEYSQIDSLFSDIETTDLSEKDTAAISPHKETTTIFHPTYILHYDTLNFRYSLDSAAIKTYKVDLTVGDGGNVKGFIGNSIRPVLKHQDGIFLILLLSFFLIGKMIQRGHSYFVKGLRLLATFREKRDDFSEITIKEFWGNLFLIILPAFLVSLLSYQYLQNGDDTIHPPGHIWCTIIGFTLVISLFVLFKYLFYSLIGYTFDVKEEMTSYLRVYFALNELFGILIFIPTLIFLYFGTYPQTILLIVIILYLITRVILFLRLIFFFLSKKINFLFGIVYLCSVEISPYVFLILGFIFFYKEDFFCVL